MSKKSYMSLLKEAIAEFDTSDHLDVKGPMLDPILSWEGDGELPIYKDAASILERYYFNEDNDKGVETMDEGELQADYQNDKGSAGGESMKNAEGTGTEQAGTSDSDTIAGAKKDKEKDIAKEGLQREQEDEEDEEVVDESTEMENAIIEKLISEMEEDDDDDDESEEEEVEEAEVMNYTGDGPKEEAPKEKKATGPEQDTHGAGTEQAGTGPDEGQIPPRKDIHDKLVKPKEYTDENTMIEAALAELEREIAEQDEMPAPDGDEGGDDEDKDLDVDKKMKEQAPPPSAVPGGPSPKKQGEDYEDDEAAYSEAFKLFKEAIEDDDEEEKEEKED